MIRLIVGLGNPGEKYRDTWHNLGWRTVEKIAAKAGVGLKISKGQCLSVDFKRGGEKVTLMVPTTYMNLSGGPVGAWMRFFKASPDELLVIYDDHDIPFGRIRVRSEGSAGGHRGAEDIIRTLGTEAFHRLRIGIRTDREHENLADQVLTPIPKRLAEPVARVIDATTEAALHIVDNGAVSAGNKYNGLELG